MEKNEKLSYTITWSQPYAYSTEFIMIDLTEMFEASVETELALGDFSAALEVINMIRNKK